MRAFAWIVVINLVSCAEGDSGAITLADPPSRGEANPLKVNTLPARPGEVRLDAAERLRRKGVESGSIWDLKECVAFFPEYAPCHRDLGVIVFRQESAGSGFLRDGLNGLREYLRLRPGAEDREDVLGLIADYEAKDFEEKRLQRRWAGRFPAANESGKWSFDRKRVLDDNTIEKLAGLFEPVDDVKSEELKREIARVHELRRGGRDIEAVKRLEEFLRSPPPEAMDRARARCELGLANVRTSPGKAEEAFKAGIGEFRYGPMNHYCLCVMLPDDAGRQEYCKIYMTLVGKSGRHYRDAQGLAGMEMK